MLAVMSADVNLRLNATVFFNSYVNLVINQIWIEILKVKMDNLLEARENASDEVGIGFTSASNWLSRWREFFGQITGRSKAKPKQSEIHLDTQLDKSLLY